MAKKKNSKPTSKKSGTQKSTSLLDEVEWVELPSHNESMARIADALTEWVTLERERFNLEHPPKAEVKPATLAEARYRKPQDQESDPDKEALQFIGPREQRRFELDLRKKKQEARSSAKAGD